jgi:hypothetical protein
MFATTETGTGNGFNGGRNANEGKSVSMSKQERGTDPSNPATHP